MKIPKGAAVLIAEPDGRGGQQAWCPPCKRYHQHGLPEGHRVAHCLDGSPYKRGGYYLVSAETARRLGLPVPERPRRSRRS